MTSQILLRYIQGLENLFKKHQPIAKSSIDELMGGVNDALELGRGDLRRYGCLLESTTREIERAIRVVAHCAYIEEARICVENYAKLEQQEAGILTTI